MTQSQRISIPKSIGSATANDTWEITKIKNNHYKVIHLPTGWQYLCWSNGISHVYQCSEVTFDAKAKPHSNSTPLVSYQSLTHMLNTLLPPYIDAKLKRMEMEQLRLIREKLKEDRLRMAELGRNVETVEVPRQNIPEYVITTETDILTVYAASDGTSFKIQLVDPATNEYKAGWCILDSKEVELGFGFTTRDEAIEELIYLISAPDIVTQWKVNPLFQLGVKKIGDHYSIIWRMQTGAIWDETECDGLFHLTNNLMIVYRSLKRIYNPFQKIQEIIVSEVECSDEETTATVRRFLDSVPIKVQMYKTYLAMK